MNNGIEIGNGITLTDVKIWPMRNPEASRVKAMVTITLNDTMQVNGCRIIEGAKGLFLSFPSEKKQGSDQYFSLFHTIDRRVSDKIQAAVLTHFSALERN